MSCTISSPHPVNNYAAYRKAYRTHRWSVFPSKELYAKLYNHPTESIGY